MQNCKWAYSTMNYRGAAGNWSDNYILVHFALSRNLFALTQFRSILYSGSNSKIGILSFLAGNSEAVDDNYFIAARIFSHIKYQLPHAIQTGLDRYIPFSVVVSPDVTEVKSQAYWSRSNPFNVGFFVYSLSRHLFRYYTSLLYSSKKFELMFLAQNLLN